MSLAVYGPLARPTRWPGGRGSAGPARAPARGGVCAAPAGDRLL